MGELGPPGDEAASVDSGHRLDRYPLTGDGGHVGQHRQAAQAIEDLTQSVDGHRGQIAALAARVAVLEKEASAFLWSLGGLSVAVVVLLILAFVRT